MLSAGFAQTIVELVRCVDRVLDGIEERDEPELEPLAADLRRLRESVLRELGRRLIEQNRRRGGAR
jgi:hypothetical protein